MSDRSLLERLQMYLKDTPYRISEMVEIGPDAIAVRYSKEYGGFFPFIICFGIGSWGKGIIVRRTGDLENLWVAFLFQSQIQVNLRMKVLHQTILPGNPSCSSMDEFVQRFEKLIRDLGTCTPEQLIHLFYDQPRPLEIPEGLRAS